MMRNTPYEVGMMFLEDWNYVEVELWIGDCMEGWGWMGHEDYCLRNMEGEDTWHGRWPLVVVLLRDNSLISPFPWQGYLSLRNCGGYEWNRMWCKDNEVDFPCQR